MYSKVAHIAAEMHKMGCQRAVPTLAMHKSSDDRLLHATSQAMTCRRKRMKGVGCGARGMDISNRLAPIANPNLSQNGLLCLGQNGYNECDERHAMQHESKV